MYEKGTKEQKIDLTSENAAHILCSEYEVISKNCTLRTKISANSTDENEFHPYWNSFKAESSRNGYIKIWVKTFEPGYDFPIDNWSMWFDVSVCDNNVKATCQLEPKLTVILMQN